MSMKVRDLIAALKKYPPDKYVFFAMQGSEQMFFVDKVETTRFADYPCIETNDAPNFADIKGMADACWEADYDSLSELERAAMLNFSEQACQAEKERRLEAVV